MNTEISNLQTKEHVFLKLSSHNSFALCQLFNKNKFCSTIFLSGIATVYSKCNLLQVMNYSVLSKLAKAHLITKNVIFHMKLT